MATKRAFIARFAALMAVLSLLTGCNHKPQPAPLSDVAEPIASPGWINFRADATVKPGEFFARYADALQLAPGTEMRALAAETDELGITHHRYQQRFRDIDVEGAEFLLHAKGDKLLSANGRLAHRFAPATVAPAFDEARALAVVRERMQTDVFYAGTPLADALRDDRTTTTPRGELLFAAIGPQPQYVLAWRFDAYVAPVDRSLRLYVDAASGAIIKEVPLLPNCFTTNAATSFRGNQSFNTARRNIPGLGDRFVLVDDCHGNELRQQSFNFTSGSSKEIFDSDNNWSDQDRGLVTSFWALGVAYDFFDLVHKRKGYDNKNANMVSINHPTLGNNASGGGGVITIGIAGPGSGDDYNTTDVVGHEYTHNVIETSAKLSYDVSKESAALNESFSDIFGEMTEAWEEQTTSPDWVIAADKGCAGAAICRNLQNPKAFSQPDTYKGTFWQAGATPDPHVNGTVQNRWYALVAAGGNGTNVETGQTYNINGIGIAKAQRIAYRTLTRYLVSSSDYVAARDGSIQAAVDLFGPGSAEEAAVTQAWCAVKLCPYTIPTQPDRFDRPGGNPNPASPNNNNSLAGATPITAAQWIPGKRPTLSIDELSVFGVGDRDYFQIALPSVSLLGGACFPSGIAFSFSAPLDVRVLVDGQVVDGAHNVSSIKAPFTSGNFALQIESPFPGLILDYGIKAGFFQSVDPHCWQTEPPTVFERIRNCPMCDVTVFTRPEEVILDPDYRQPELVAPQQHYFQFRGGELSLPIAVMQGNALQVELLDSSGNVVQRTQWQHGSGAQPTLQATDLAAGIYALRFSGFGNGTQVRVAVPGE